MYYNSSFLQQQKTEMDGKPAVSSKPARTDRNAPVACQLPEPCDDQRLQMVSWYNPRQHILLILYVSRI